MVASSGPAANAIEVVSSDGDDDFEDALEYGDDEMDNAGYYENADPGQAAGGAISMLIFIVFCERQGLVCLAVFTVKIYSNDTRCQS